MYFQLAIDSDNALYAPIAAFNLGLLLQKQSDLDGAIAAYRQAAGSGHAHFGPVAAVNLGVLLVGQGDVAGALAAYQQAIDSHHPTLCYSAWDLLQSLFADHGDIPAVRAAHQRVIDTGFVDLTRGAELHQRGDTEAARAAYEHAIALRHPEYAPAASNNLGVLLKDQGDVDGAIAAYQQAIASDHPDQLPKAAINLGLLYKSLQMMFLPAQTAPPRQFACHMTADRPYAARRSVTAVLSRDQALPVWC